MILGSYLLIFVFQFWHCYRFYVAVFIVIDKATIANFKKEAGMNFLLLLWPPNSCLLTGAA